MKISPLSLAALAVAAIDGFEAIGTRGPQLKTPDYFYGGVLDAQGRTWVVKYPRNTHAATVIEAEAAIAPSLLEELASGNLPFDVMRPSGFANVEHGRALVYPTPIGKTHEFENLNEADAHELGRILATIHQLSSTTVAQAGMPVYDADSLRRRLLAELHDIDTASKLPPILRRRWENAFEAEELWDFNTTVVHADIAAENILWSDGSVSCVLGFGEAHVGDPAIDFSTLVSALPEELFDAVYTSYSNSLSTAVDEHFFTRAVLMSEFAIARWLMFGLRHNDCEIIKEAQDMLDELAADVAADPELAPGPSWKVDSLSPLTVDSADEAGFTTTYEDTSLTNETSPDQSPELAESSDWSE